MSFRAQIIQPHVAFLEFRKPSLDQVFTDLDWNGLHLQFEGFCDDPTVNVIVLSNVGHVSSELARFQRNDQTVQRMRKCIDAVTVCAKRKSLFC